MHDPVHDPTCRGCGAKLAWARNRKGHHVPLESSAALSQVLEQNPRAVFEDLQVLHGVEAVKHRCGRR